jgi:hypothetical protein
VTGETGAGVSMTIAILSNTTLVYFLKKNRQVIFKSQQETLSSLEKSQIRVPESRTNAVLMFLISRCFAYSTGKYTKDEIIDKFKSFNDAKHFLKTPVSKMSPKI